MAMEVVFLKALFWARLLCIIIWARIILNKTVT